MFTITRHRGFRLEFENGFAVSVQFGPGHYCEHYDSHDYNAAHNSEWWESKTAEVAIIGINGELIDQEAWGDSVTGYVTTDDLAGIINQVSAFSAGNNQLKEVS